MRVRDNERQRGPFALGCPEMKGTSKEIAGKKGDTKPFPRDWERLGDIDGRDRDRKIDIKIEREGGRDSRGGGRRAMLLDARLV